MTLGGVLATRPHTPSCGILLVGIAGHGRVPVARCLLPHLATHVLLRMACPMRVVRRLMITVVPLALALGGAWLYAWHWYAAPGPLTAAKTVLIAPGLGFRGIARVLAQEGVIGQPLLYMLRVRLAQQHAALQAGEYAFLPGIAPQAVTQKLTQGAVVLHSLTIPAGVVSDDIRVLLAQEPLLTGDLPDTIAEGAVLPETYVFRRGDSRTQVLARMQVQMQAALANAWQARQPDVPLRTPQEALILASIVEKETGLPQERGRVAAVFLNRLRRGMKLQADPTTVYGIFRASGERKAGLTTRDLASDSPYNTYRIPGLPPGPITHPSQAAIEAVLHPPESAELYFVATGTGGHVFATTLDEHQRNVAAYRNASHRSKD
jgi:peptidoglycan lytic transglycosylase G